MLDLKAKLLAAGIVTAEQVKKVEDEEAHKKQRAKEARERKQQGKKPPPPEKKRDPDDPEEKLARKENALVEAERWRKRLDELRAAGKSDQYEATRGWVTRHRLDTKQISEAAERFHFMKADASVSHLTVEPDVKALLASGEAAVVMFMGFNGLEHAVVPKDIALDIRHVRPEWLRALAGVTDVEPVPADAPAESAESGDAAPAEALPDAEPST